jgi:hypothetical protein
MLSFTLRASAFSAFFCAFISSFVCAGAARVTKINARANNTRFIIKNIYLFISAFGTLVEMLAAKRLSLWQTT